MSRKAQIAPEGCFFLSHDNVIKENICSGMHGGILILNSDRAHLRDNIISNRLIGIELNEAENIILSGTQMSNTGIRIIGDSLSHWNNHIIKSTGFGYLLGNVINGKPVYYYKNSSGRSVPSDAGQVIFANCDSMTVENLTLNNCSIGVLMGFTTNSSIANNTLYGNYHGIEAYESHWNTFDNNDCSFNLGGFRLYYSDQNTLINNLCRNNTLTAIDLSESSGAVLKYNVVVDNVRDGISISSSSESFVIENNTVSNNLRGISVSFGYYSRITNNKCNGNDEEGIRLVGVQSCEISNNTCDDNNVGILFSGDNNSLVRNQMRNNEDGFIIKYAEDNDINNNSIRDSERGICVEFSSVRNTFRYNEITGSWKYGFDALGNQGHLVDARYNWWGDKSGPFHIVENPGGKGDEVTDYVDFDPWIDEGGEGGNESGRPDFAITSLSVSNDNPIEGDHINITIIFSNIGTKPANGVILKLSIIDDQGNIRIRRTSYNNEMPIGGHTTWDTIFDTSEHFGWFTIQAEIDPENSIKEWNESNNGNTIPIHIFYST